MRKEMILPAVLGLLVNTTLWSQDRLAATAQQASSEDKLCTSCHTNAENPHQSDRFAISCNGCHGGKTVTETDVANKSTWQAQRKCPAAPTPLFPKAWPTSANPEQLNTTLMRESWDYVRFVNPGDLRVADVTCGTSNCHAEVVLAVKKSLMTTAAHFWGTASYCNGILPVKKTILGQSYAADGRPQKINTVWRPGEEKLKGIDLERMVVETVVPLPHWEVTQPGNIFRVFEKGSRFGGPALGFNGLSAPTIGLPDKLEEAGRPNNRLSDRGLGTLNRVDLPLLNVHKSRLNDPYLSLMGTNDAPGDYRSSGCTACHFIYANDRSLMHSGPYAFLGNLGHSHSTDPMIPRGESGHPLRHEFTTRIPSSTCMVCHMHQPNSFVNTYYGYQMWSYETDGDQLWPKTQKHPSNSQYVGSLMRNPEGAAITGLWGDPKFLNDVSSLNPTLKHTQFADYHGHGWIFRAVFKMDRKGNLLDEAGKIVPYDDPKKFEGVVPLAVQAKENADADQLMDEAKFTELAVQRGKAVHLKDIHAERGMHCVDCHYSQDVHGNGKIYAEYQAAVQITCQDCHGTVQEYATLKPTGPAGYTSGIRSFADLKTEFGKSRFEVQRDATGRQVFTQRSMLFADKSWRVKQVKDIVDKTSGDYNEKAARAKTLQKDGSTWGNATASVDSLAHTDSKMMCQSCHTSWITSCFGCHLPQKANMRTPMRHYETKMLRNYASYNPQVARDDAFMLGVTGDVHQNRISTVRSSSAVMISSEDSQRQKIYVHIPTTAANGMSSQAFNTHFAHTVRTKETRQCDDCHVSAKNDNNAWLAQTYLLGTNFVNFFGYNAYVGAGSSGFYAVRVTEWEEPQAIIGSNLHRLAYPDDFQAHVASERHLKDSVKHAAGGPEALLNFFWRQSEVQSVQLRGEYLFTACGKGGFRAFDVANVGNKGFSEKIVSSPVSPLGQDTHVSLPDATAVALPTNNYISMARTYRPENREQPYKYKGRDQNMHEIYRYAFVTDREEGLVVIDVDCLSDGDPENNFFRKTLAFNPDGALRGATNLTLAGTIAYVCTPDGLFAIDLDDPVAPRMLGKIGAPELKRPGAVQVQFRYAFVCDADGLKVLDVTAPDKMVLVANALVAIDGAVDVYLARTYAYVAAGKNGMAIVDIEVPTEPKLLQTWNADGQLNDVRQIKVGMSYDSVFAFVADGANGFRIVQLVSPEDTDVTKRSAYGFSPKPSPKLIATYPTSGPALCVSKGLDRDRAADESGNQMAVFGRIGGRPLSLQERQRFYLKKDGKVYTVTNE